MTVAFIHVAPLITSSAFLMGSFAQGIAFRSFQNPKLGSKARREVFLHWVEIFASFAWSMALVFMFNITFIGLNLYLEPPSGLQNGGAPRWLWAAALLCSMGHPRPREVTAALMRISRGGDQSYSAEKVEYFLRGYRRVNLEHLFLTDGPSWIFTVAAVTKNLGVCWGCHSQKASLALGMVALIISCYVSVRGILRSKS
ncbi:hypothetical protein GCG54_00008688 [Colletotrichum gloeosporioides]|uniref:Uncharacterized protein n=1 Tax=Colletotrichum gloeosporioides TaxID=474922 RepID=A0A8H4CNJ6_COLGL|nr:uncharacterized protein GCG54_00008688 [Colletotrichum gloeosporioides]KAF3807233.1 hypothetical protein GCG54_00008688 [Colletotrichum gloeosporioides]